MLGQEAIEFPPPHLALKCQDITYDPYDLENPLLQCNTYHYGKTAYLGLVKEMKSTFQGAPCAIVHHKDDIDRICDIIEYAWQDYTGPSEPLSWSYVVNTKPHDTSVGFPLKAYCSNFGDLLDHYGELGLVQELEKAEKSILEGTADYAAYMPFPKLDKYKDSKVLANRMRLVSTGPVFQLLLAKRWYSKAVELLEQNIPQFYLITDEDAYRRKVVDRLTGGYSWGIDYTSFDKNSTSYLTFKAIQVLDNIMGNTVPRRIFEYLALTISQPLSIIVNPSGEAEWFLLTNTNPSGQFLTSYCNSFSHLVHNALFVDLKLKEHVLDYLSDRALIRSAMTGDDGIDSTQTDQLARWMSHDLANFVFQEFEIPAKLEMMEIEGTEAPFPIGMLPPYLNKMMVSTANGYYTIPVNLLRYCPRLTFLLQNDLKGKSETELMSERGLGILEDLKPLIAHEYLNPTMPRNAILKILVDRIKALGVTIDNPYTYTKCMQPWGAKY